MNTRSNPNKRKTWLSFGLFAGAFLSIYGLISAYEEGCGFFSCTLVSNGVPVTLIQEVLTYAGLGVAISSIGLMSIGEAGSGGHYPSKHALLDFALILGTFFFFVGLGAYNAICAESCWGYQYEFGSPMMLLGVGLAGMSFYFLRKRFKVTGEHLLGWELLAVGSLAFLLVCMFLGFPGLEPSITIVEYSDLNFQQFVFIIAAVVGLLAGLGGMLNEKKDKKDTHLIREKKSEAIAKIQGK